MSTKQASCVGWWTNVPGQSGQILLNCALWIYCRDVTAATGLMDTTVLCLIKFLALGACFCTAMTTLLELGLILKILLDILHNIEFCLKFTPYNQRQDDIARNMRVGTFQSWISVDATTEFTETVNSLFPITNNFRPLVKSVNDFWVLELNN